MMIEPRFIYLIALVPFVTVWLAIWLLRPDLRKEMLFVGTVLGIAQIFAQQYWWTVDWWRPETIFGTRVGIEDFLLGFFGGGVSAVLYETLFRKRHERLRITCAHCPGIVTLLLLMTLITSWLFWGLGLTSFAASSLAIVGVAGLMFLTRRDLFVNGVLSGSLLTAVSVASYGIIMVLSETWIDETYLFETLSNIQIVSVPIEEFINWFLLGLSFGPLYEYWKGERIVASLKTKGPTRGRASR